MTIRFALASDFDEIKKLYWDYSGDFMATLGFKFKKEKVSDEIFNMVARNSVLLAEAENKLVGFCAGLFLDCQFSDDVMFSSMILYMRKEHKAKIKSFIRGIEDILIPTAATKFVIANPCFDESERMDRFYELMGFKTLETHYVKNINREALHAG